MKLKEGMEVPKFEVEDIEGNIVSSEDLLGMKYMVSFYRYASCPFCNLRISFLAEEYKELEILNFRLVGFFQSTKEDILKNVGKQKSPFPIISDSSLTFYRKFGVEKSIFAYIKGAVKIGKLITAHKKGFKIGKSMGPKTTVPGDFLVDEMGIIKYAYYGKDISDHLDIEIIKEFAKK